MYKAKADFFTIIALRLDIYWTINYIRLFLTILG